MTFVQRRLAILIVVLAPLVAVCSALFGGERLIPCLALNGCAPPVPGPIPIIGTQIGAIATIMVGIVAWLGAALAIAIHVGRVDRARLRRAAIAIVLVMVAAAGYGFVAGAQLRLRQGAEDAALYGLGAFIVAATLSLAWAGASVPARGLPHP